MRRGLSAFALTFAFSAIFVTGASAALQGPVYPVPGGLNTGHGGNTCFATSDVDGAAGKDNSAFGQGIGQTFTYGGDTDTTPQAGCPYEATPPAPTAFDTTRFEALYWGISSTPRLALDGLFDEPGEGGETMTIQPDGGGLTNYANGEVAWIGQTEMTWCEPGIPTPRRTAVPVSRHRRFPRASCSR